MSLKKVEIISSEFKNTSELSELTSYVGKEVFSKSGEPIGSVKEIVVHKDKIKGAVISSKKDFYIDKEQFALNEHEVIILKIDPIFALIGKKVYDSQGKERTLEFLVMTRDRMNISQWERIVLGRMSGILIGSILLLLFVVGLFYYSIKNLIKQKKVADVKTDFVNNITHELKTPLATLSLASKSLKQKEILESPKAFENTLGILDRQNSRLQKLIDQVMSNSLGSEELVLNKEQIIDNNYFKNIIDDFSLSVQSQTLNIQTQIEPKEVILRIDTILFTTALFNILENAVKYGKESVEIKISTRLLNDHYEIEVSDNGIGISEKNQKYIFDKFYRVASGNIHNVKGLGLGLFYTKQVVDAHDGNIQMKSQANKGTTFTITIPVN